MKKIKFLKKVTLVLAVATLVLGFVPVPVVGRVGTIYADSSTEQSGEEQTDDVTTEESSPVDEPVAEIKEEISQDESIAGKENTNEENTNGEETGKQSEEQKDEGNTQSEGDEAQPAETQPVEVQPLSLSFSAQTVSSAIGDDPNVQTELPDFGTNYGNGDCVTNDSCETAEPVTNPNDYSDQGTYGEKDYSLPDIDGNEANIVAVKEGNQWYFFKEGSGETCVESSFCVEFDNSGNVSVYSYQTQANGYKGYNMIHFWYAEEPNEEIPGCTDASALNYDASATTDDGSCVYEEEIYGCTDVTALNYDASATTDDGSCVYDPGDPGGDPPVTTLIPVTAPAAGGPTEELLLIPVTGVDLDSAMAGYQQASLFMSAMLFGISFVLEGVSGKSKRK